MYKVVFSDIDGTLLTSSHQVTPDTRRKILELEKAGIPFILVSARMPEGITAIQKLIGNHGPIVSYSGGLILGPEGEVLYSRQMSLNLALEIKNLLSRDYPGLCCNTYGHDKWVVDDDRNPWVCREEEITTLKALTGGIQEWFRKDGGIHKFLIMGEPEEIARAAVRLKAEYPQVNTALSTPSYLEVMDAEVKKSAGVRFLCDYFGITTEEAVAIGDGQNDIDMLQAAGRSYAMGNAPKEVQESADYVTLDHDHEGVLAALEELGNGCFG